MDWVGTGSRFMDVLKKYRYVLLVVLAGIFLMALPEGESEQTELPAQETQVRPTEDLQEALASILSKIEGAGKVEVLLTQASGEETVYQSDGDGESRQDTVTITNADRAETGLIRQVNPPEYLGAVVVCQGAERASIRLSIVEAVSNATGLSSDKITVLKMK